MVGTSRTSGNRPEDPSRKDAEPCNGPKDAFPELLGVPAGGTGAQDLTEQDRAIANRLNNFIHLLPGGFQRDQSKMGALMEPALATTPLRDWLRDHNSVSGLTLYSKKRLDQTGQEFLAEIDSVIVELGHTTADVLNESKEYQALARFGKRTDFLVALAEPIFNALIERGYNEFDLKT